MFRPLFALFSLLMDFALVPAVRAANLTCTPTAAPIVVHGEGITERTSDIVFTCSGGAPSATMTVDFTFFLNVNVTNRLASASSDDLLGIIFTADNGSVSGPQQISATPTLIGQTSLVFNGATFTLSPTGTVTLRLANLRGAAAQLNFAANSTLQVLIGTSANASLALTSSQVTVGIPQHGLYDAFSNKIICSQQGSPLPSNPASFASFHASGTVFTSTRVTEGFADSFAPLSDWPNQGADTGTRIIVQYSGFPSGAQLFVPTVVVGSDATQPTAGGDLGLSASGGKYTAGSSTLLLSLVQNTDPNGAGGTPLYTPGAPGSGTASFDSMSQVTLTSGAGIAVYQVMDANPSIQESAQFPTFLALAPFSGTDIQTAENVSLAPISTVLTATATDPIPRFLEVPIPDDCTIVGDCHAGYFPHLSVYGSSLSYSVPAGGPGETQFLTLENTSNGIMQWTASVTYTNGSGWLNVSPLQGESSQNLRIEAIPGTLAPGTYNATLTIDAGPLAGSANVAITMIVTSPSAPAAQLPSIQTLVNGATFATGAVAPGSMATLGGSQLSGKVVTVAFDGQDAKVLFANETQINVIVPASLGSKTSAQVVATVDGTPSAPLTAHLTPFAPGIFSDGVLDQDNTLNSAKQPAAPGSIIQIYATGLSGAGAITAKIGTETVTHPYYGGPAPGITGMQQIDLIVPSNLTGASVDVSVCGGASSAKVVCSPPVSVALSK
jgi:uncharacterized protein (TIGR03437 family)